MTEKEKALTAVSAFCQWAMKKMFPVVLCMNLNPHTNDASPAAI